MNFLAHQYLSFDAKLVMVGNFIADTLKGQISNQLPAGVQLGVKIHRAIDDYTDSHDVVLKTRKLLYPYFGKYAAVVQDVYYDHFLAVHWSDHRNDKLTDFVSEVYKTLNENKTFMNAKAQRILHFMELQDWLSNYAYLSGIDRALKGLSHRAAYPSNMENGIPPLLEHYTVLNQHFLTFFPLLEKEITALFLADIQKIQPHRQSGKK